MSEAWPEGVARHVLARTDSTNAEALRTVLAGARNAYRDISLANAAASLVIAGKAETIAGGMKLATESLESGNAAAALDRLVAVSNDVQDKA